MQPFKTDDGKEYYVMHIHPAQHAVLRAYDAFAGRNWRRVKREANKAHERAMAELRRKAH